MPTVTRVLSILKFTTFQKGDTTFYRQISHKHRFQRLCRYILSDLQGFTQIYQSGITQRVICRLFATVSRIRQVSKRARKLIPALTFYLFDHKEKQYHFPFFIFIITCIFLRIFSSLSPYVQTISPIRESIAHNASVAESSS